MMPTRELVALTDNFAIRVSVRSQTIITLSGELDIAAVEPFGDVIAQIDLAPVRHVLLDLASLTFIDAAGLRAVLRLYDSCREHFVTLTIKRGPRAVQRFFELTQTECLLPFEAA
jgi:anti-sigma B factor antagonist